MFGMHTRKTLEELSVLMWGDEPFSFRHGSRCENCRLAATLETAQYRAPTSLSGERKGDGFKSTSNNGTLTQRHISLTVVASLKTQSPNHDRVV